MLLRKRILVAVLSITVTMAFTPMFGFASTADKSEKDLQGSILSDDLQIKTTAADTAAANISGTAASAEADQVEGEALAVMDSDFAATTSKKTVRKKIASVSGDIQVKGAYVFSDCRGVDAAKMRKSTAAAVRSEGELEVIHVKSDSLSTDELIDQLEANGNVKYAVPNEIMKADALTDDAYSSYQWALKNTGQNGGTPGLDTNVGSIWTPSSTTGVKGTDKVVAVVDTGVDYMHPDLAANMWVNPYQDKLPGVHGYDFCNMDADPMDDNGHGTHCAGIIGARANNRTGISGINQNVKIMALKFMSSDGRGTIAAAIACYSYINNAQKLGADIAAVNNSWGSYQTADNGIKELLKQIFDVTGEAGAVSVTAAGNEARDVDDADTMGEHYQLPGQAGSDYQINVAAVNEKDELADFSCYGKESVDLAAQGCDILSTCADNVFNPDIYSAYEKSDLVSANYTDYDSDSSWGAAEDWSVAKKPGSSAECTVTESSDMNFGKADRGRSLKLSMRNVQAGDEIIFSLPYNQAASKENPVISARTIFPKAPVTKENKNTFYIATYDKDGKVLNSIGIYVTRPENCWVGFTIKGDYTAGEKRLGFILQAESAGDFTFYVDDIGISRENVSASSFGKYLFESGTSMATPYVAGAAALVDSAAGGLTAKERISAVKNSVRKTASLSGKVETGGVLDLDTAVMTPAKATGVKAKAMGKKKVRVTWKKARNAKKYYVYRAKKKNGKYKLAGKTAKLSITQKKLKKGRKYYYKVKACRDSLQSGWSNRAACRVK